MNIKMKEIHNIELKIKTLKAGMREPGKAKNEVLARVRRCSIRPKK